MPVGGADGFDEAILSSSRRLRAQKQAAKKIEEEYFRSAVQRSDPRHHLADRRLLRECAELRAQTHCSPCVVSVSDAQAGCREKEDADIPTLAAAWKARHEVIGAAHRPLRPAHGENSEPSACWKLNYCLCNVNSRHVDSFWQRAKHQIKAIYADREARLVDGWVVLLFRGRDVRRCQSNILVVQVHCQL